MKSPGRARLALVASALLASGCDVFDYDGPDRPDVCAAVSCGPCVPLVIVIVEDAATSAGIVGVEISGAPMPLSCAPGTSLEETRCLGPIGEAVELYDITVSAPGYVSRTVEVNELLATAPPAAPGSCCAPCPELALRVPLDPA